MTKFICPECKKVYENVTNDKCPVCSLKAPYAYDFVNSDEFLINEAEKVLKERKEFGLDGLVGGLESVVINVEEDHFFSAIIELLKTTGYRISTAFENEHYLTCVLTNQDSADLLVKVRLKASNPFADFNIFPKSRHLPNTRLETFIFSSSDLQKYVEIQKSRGIEFLPPEIIEKDNYFFIQTLPSIHTGISTGILQWKNGIKNYKSRSDRLITLNVAKPRSEFLNNIGRLDHTATRVKAKDRDSAIIEFMQLTNYNFDFAIYVEMFNSITNVARLSAEDFAMVFTSGISPYIDEIHSGPTEKFIKNYGPRVHHMAFSTKNIESTYEALLEKGQKFLIELVGSPDQGLKQTFTVTSPNTLLVNEYIHRYGDFDGFFTKNNVTLLTESTDKQ